VLPDPIRPGTSSLIDKTGKTGAVMHLNTMAIDKLMIERQLGL
jgi:hypothetical protein